MTSLCTTQKESCETYFFRRLITRAIQKYLKKIEQIFHKLWQYKSNLTTFWHGLLPNMVISCDSFSYLIYYSPLNVGKFTKLYGFAVSLQSMTNKKFYLLYLLGIYRAGNIYTVWKCKLLYGVHWNWLLLNPDIIVLTTLWSRVINNESLQRLFLKPINTVNSWQKAAVEL